MKIKLFAFCLTASFFSFLPCTINGDEFDAPSKEEVAAASAITSDALAGHIQFLSDDLLEGRGPGTRGDELTQAYLVSQFKSIGLKPSAPDGSWRQPVSLIAVKTTMPKKVAFRGASESLELNFYDEILANSGRPIPEVSLSDSELVFVGYGIQAPEYDWDDFKGVDFTGKTLVIMNNDPSDDPELFAGKRRLYYGRWDYKYDMAARIGAAGAIIIHTTPSAGYPFQVVQTSWTGPQSELKGRTGARLDVSGWVTDDAAKKLAKLGGHDLDELRAMAEKRDFRPVPLNVKYSIDLTCEIIEQNTANVIGLLEGSDPELSDEVVVYTAHHDHIGIAEKRDARGDNIYNGAVDNATGTSAILTIARAFANLPKKPARSILFAAVGAEEQGLLGSEYLAANPPMPAGKMAAVVNIDGLNTLGRSRDINFIGYGKSSLDRIVQGFAKLQNRVVVPDTAPDKGYYYRSDQFNLAKIGVPGVYLHSGIEILGKPQGWGKEQNEEWIKTKYHQPSDEYSEDWNLEGAVEDSKLLFYVGLRVAQEKEMPQWNPGDEFEAARKAALSALGN